MTSFSGGATTTGDLTNDGSAHWADITVNLPSSSAGDLLVMSWIDTAWLLNNTFQPFQSAPGVDGVDGWRGFFDMFFRVCDGSEGSTWTTPTEFHGFYYGPPTSGQPQQKYFVYVACYTDPQPHYTFIQERFDTTGTYPNEHVHLAMPWSNSGSYAGFEAFNPDLAQPASEFYLGDVYYYGTDVDSAFSGPTERNNTALAEGGTSASRSRSRMRYGDLLDSDVDGGDQPSGDPYVAVGPKAQGWTINRLVNFTLVSPAAPTCSITFSPASPYYSNDVVATAHIIDGVTAVSAFSLYASQVPDGTVEFILDGGSLGTVSLSSDGGYGVFKAVKDLGSSLATGMHTLEVVYSGGDYPALIGGLTGTNCSEDFTVLIPDVTCDLISFANPATTGDTVTFEHQISVPGFPTPGGTVEFFRNGVSLGTVAVVASVADIDVLFASAGEYSMQAVYSGDPDIGAGPCTDTLTEIVNDPPPPPPPPTAPKKRTRVEGFWS